MTKITQRKMIEQELNQMAQEERQKLRKILNSIIGLHETMKGAYFYSPPPSAKQRRSYEDRHTRETTFKLGDEEYIVEQKTICSCKDVYYSLSIWTDKEVSYCLNAGFLNKVLDIISTKYAN